MDNRRFRKPNLRARGKRVLVTDPAMLDGSAVAEPVRQCEGDVITGLRYGLIFSAAIWAMLLIAGLLIFA